MGGGAAVWTLGWVRMCADRSGLRHKNRTCATSFVMATTLGTSRVHGRVGLTSTGLVPS